jgi:uncharacterized protein YbaP (TraB family)
VNVAPLRVAALAASLAALLAGALASATAPPSAATAPVADSPPLIWTVSGPHGTLTIAGSIHALRDGDHPLPPAYDAAYAAAARLVLEVEVDGRDAAREQRKALAAGRLPRGTRLRDVLGAERWHEAETLATAAAVDLAEVQRQEPWLAALTLSNQAWRAQGLEARRGLDRHYLARARADGKPVLGLERAGDQLGLFDRLPPSEQQRYLLDTLRGLPTIAQELDDKIAAWRRGDLAEWEGALDSFAATPALRAALLDERHARWLPQLERMLAEPTPTLVVVGTLHLVGPGSVLAELARRGYRVERVGASAAR